MDDGVKVTDWVVFDVGKMTFIKFRVDPNNKDSTTQGHISDLRSAFAYLSEPIKDL